MEKLAWNFKAVVASVRKGDPAMADLIKSLGYRTFEVRHDYFHALCRSIIGQQVSVKAAQSIYNKVTGHFADAMTPVKLSKASAEELRSCGLSRQKASYLVDLATHFVKDPDHFGRLDDLNDEDVIAHLVHVKGVGKWTAQMFLIFVLARPDVFAPDDLGLRNAMIKLYGWKKAPDRAKLEKTAAKWKPYRSFASRYLWISLANEPAPK